MSNQKEFYLCATMIIAIKSEKKIKDMREKKEKYDAAPWAKKKSSQNNFGARCMRNRERS
jgi:CRISPR/Cas system CSM-associated protein Csm5 (group 7 of RAMP superfamily)